MYTDETFPPTLSPAISVWIVEDHESYRETIQSLIDSEDEMRCTAGFPDCESMLAELNPVTAPDVVLMDIGLPGMNGIKGVIEIKDRTPSVPIIMLTVHGDNDNIFDAICAGASGYLLKTAPGSSIIKAIREVLEGGSMMSPKIARRVLNMFAQQNKPRIQDYGLTDREKEVLELCKTGRSKKQIADILCVSVHTIDTHMRNIYEKLEVHSRAALIRKLYGLRD